LFFNPEEEADISKFLEHLLFVNDTLSLNRKAKIENVLVCARPGGEVK
jgi:hypothetical protein